MRELSGVEKGGEENGEVVKFKEVILA